MKFSGHNDLLGNGTELEGKLICDGDIRINGHFSGEISVNGTLSIGEEGFVEANIHAPYVAIGGGFHGNITADKRVEILPPAKVYGDIEAPSVVLEKGAIFEGNCRMLEAKSNKEDKALRLIKSDEPLIDPPTGSGDLEETGSPEAIS
jgi:cytoskeletal protein CcmA (bactofilin family)